MLRGKAPLSEKVAAEELVHQETGTETNGLADGGSEHVSPNTHF